MAPSKILNVQNKQSSTNVIRKGITTRSQNSALNNVLLKAPANGKESRVKRKAEASPPKEKTTKRSALGNITNAIGKTLGTHQTQEPKKAVKKTTVTQIKSFTQTSSIRTLEKGVIKPEVIPQKPKPVPRVKPIKKDEEKTEIPSKILNVRRSLDLEKSEDSSLYVSALEEITDDSTKKSRRSNIQPEEPEKTEVENESNEPQVPAKTQERSAAQLDAAPEQILPEGVQWDFDAENWLDPFQVSHYAMDIFNYLKSREHLFPIGDYMERQVCLSPWMRALLVDWMVEVQESFELNHETLYLAVKLVDLYLTKVTVVKETLQLLGAASLFIASKYDERIPPMVEDFLYICDGAYKQRALIRMEMSILKVVDFDLGIPLSYRFLRRYARVNYINNIFFLIL